MKIYLAGIYTSYMKLLRKDIRHGFHSYYYILEKKQTLKDLGRIRSKCQDIIVDSGAHSFFSEYNVVRLLSVASPTGKKDKVRYSEDEFFEMYLDWLIKNRGLYEYFVELDIGEIFGQEKIRGWRKIIRAKGLYDKCITAFHPQIMSFQDYLNLIDDSASKFVAIEGDSSFRERLPYTKLIKPAYEKGVRVHGFQLTKKEVLENYPFYSVDSTTWLAGALYGRVPISGRTHVEYCDLFEYRDGHDRQNLPIAIVRGGGLVSALSEEPKVRAAARLGLGIKAFEDAEDYYTALWKKRGIVWED